MTSVALSIPRTTSSHLRDRYWKGVLDDTLKHYGVYLAVGVLVEVISLAGLHVLRQHVMSFWINNPNLLLGIAISFALHFAMTWRDRPGNLFQKLGRFTGVTFCLWALEALLFFFWWRRNALFACPAYWVTSEAVDLFVAPASRAHFHMLFQCTWMSLASLDFLVTMTAGFVAHNWFSFWKKED